MVVADEGSYKVPEPDTSYRHCAPTAAAVEVVEAEKKTSCQMHPGTLVEVHRRQFEMRHLYCLKDAEETASSVAAAEAYAASGLDRMGRLLCIRLLSLAATWFYLYHHGGDVVFASMSCCCCHSLFLQIIEIGSGVGKSPKEVPIE